MRSGQLTESEAKGIGECLEPSVQGVRVGIPMISSRVLVLWSVDVVVSDDVERKERKRVKGDGRL